MKAIAILIFINTLLFAPYEEPENVPAPSKTILISQKKATLESLREQLNKIEQRLSSSEKALEKYNKILKEHQQKLTVITQTGARCDNYKLELDSMIQNKYNSRVIAYKRKLVNDCKEGYSKRIDFFRNLTILMNEMGKDADDLEQLAKIDHEFAHTLKEDISQTLSEIKELEAL